MRSTSTLASKSSGDREPDEGRGDRVTVERSLRRHFGPRRPMREMLSEIQDYCG